MLSKSVVDDVANFKANGDGLNAPSSVDVGLVVMYKTIIIRIMILANPINIFHHDFNFCVFIRIRLN